MRMLTICKMKGMERMRRTFVAVLLAIVLAAPCCACVQEKGWLALTFDDGPSGELTEALLEGLREQEVRATFFVCGYRVTEFPDALRHIAEAGHEIGLHSCCHDYMHKMSKAEVLNDLTACQELIEQTCGVRTYLFRPPGGLYSDELLDAAKELGLSLMLWSVDPQDWDIRLAKAARQHVDANVFPGAVILMHELSMDSVRSALGAIEDLKREGYRFCTVSELAFHAGEALEAGAIYYSFPGACGDE